MPTIALLTLNEHSYDVKLLNQCFELPVGWNGFPKQSLPGNGQLRLLMDTPADNFILELMMKTEETPLQRDCLRYTTEQMIYHYVTSNLAKHISLNFGKLSIS
ncbi:hypothetical protein [Prevotella melaninogenica]|uniref:hypothetical protein n=1 Tax=Prevotella melaninogenica TaxID=28132 RepID=UPI003C778BDB